MAARDPRTAAEPYPREDARESRNWSDLAAADTEEGWRSRTRIVLTPMSAPSIMGLFGFFAATAMVGSWQAGWYGSSTTPSILWPFALFFGGLAQLTAAFFALRARDGVAVAAHSTWGSFWLGWGVLTALASTGIMKPIPLGSTNTAFGFWFIVLAAITLMCAVGAMFDGIAIAVVLWTLFAGAGLTAVGFWAGSLGWTHIGGWLFVASAVTAWYTASAMMLENAMGRTVLPLGKYSKAANVPGGHATVPMAYSAGMPGSKVGQ